MKRSGRAFVLAALLALSVRGSPATTIIPIPWEELVLGADFIGIVEVEVAGGIVAEYRVVESWKGAKAGTRFRVRKSVNYWGGQFPVVLCGERYFMTAFRSSPENRLSDSVGGPVPLWWRNIPADYQLPLRQGSKWLGPGDEKGDEFLADRKKTQELLGATPARQEEILLRLSVERWVLRSGGDEKEEGKELREKLAKASSTEEMVKGLLALAASDPKTWGRSARYALGGGRAITLAALEKAGKLPWSKKETDELLERLRHHLGKGVERPAPKAPPAPRPPTAVELKRLRAALKAGPEGSDDFGTAFEVLTRHDPGLVAGYLRDWKAPEKDGRSGTLGHGLGSYFGWKCGKDRARHLATLLEAKDAWMRVAGAVYLCFDDEKKGAAALKKFTALEGNPGTWAALTLARRGHKDAVPRLLRTFGPLSKEEEETGHLRARARVLLSNSAHRSKVPAPPAVEREDGGAALLKWWKTHEAKLALHDPWMDILQRQKID